MIIMIVTWFDIFIVYLFVFEIINPTYNLQPVTIPVKSSSDLPPGCFFLFVFNAICVIIRMCSDYSFIRIHKHQTQHDYNRSHNDYPIQNSSLSVCLGCFCISSAKTCRKTGEDNKISIVEPFGLQIKLRKDRIIAWQCAKFSISP